MAKDTVCGLTVDKKHALAIEYEGKRYYFCSQTCRNLFEQHTIVPLYYNDRDRWLDIMRYIIACNASFFNTQRMALQYVLSAYSYNQEMVIK